MGKGIIDVGTKVVFLLSGNDAAVKVRLQGVEDLPKQAEVWIVYSDRIPQTNEKLIRAAANANTAVRLDCVRHEKSKIIQRRLMVHVDTIHKARPDVMILVVSGRLSLPGLSSLEAKGYFTYIDSVSASDLVFLHEMEMEDRSIMGRLTGRSRIGDIDAFDDADDIDDVDDVDEFDDI